ncbi:hypothetical protein BUALT_Bualt01G0060600 [Buddleja alternifolia]|uniref:Histone-lysine N-methyltransferase SETMAR n=1 Tax=Buddleja alternifolia TaxID=168488 RepID=A0AAV6YBS6_9LAMI|nr:hypothetical protein BUALT_Bualt01G0060600 [Buddleja alternifolia]
MSRKEECCLVSDLSEGMENFEVRVMNGVDDEKPKSFSYLTKVLYPYHVKALQESGCDCTNGCSNCKCLFKNGGEIPFTEKGAIIGPKPIIYECGPSCKCPPSCMNRVGQSGSRIQLEVFRTGSGGWGVRSQSYISSGSFVCEYIGQLKQVKDNYLGEGTLVGKKERGLALDTKKSGNVARFICQSDDLPNLFAQRVLYDHDDLRMPHIMFFATKDIPPLQELSYEYDYDDPLAYQLF